MEKVTGEIIDINNKYKSYQEYKTAVDREMQASAEGFVRIGYLLKLARDTDILKETPYESVNEFAYHEYGLDKSQVSRFIKINDEYSEGGYSDQLRVEYRGYGYAKLAIMILLPASVAGEISSGYSKREIQMVKEELDEEKKTTDLEILMEEKDRNQEKMGIFAKVLYQLGRDDAELYIRMHGAVKEGLGEQQIWRMFEILAPNGESILNTRIPGEGRKMLSIKGTDVPPAVIDMRSYERKECSWQELDADMQSLCRDEDAVKSWEILYGDPFPEKEKRQAVPDVKTIKKQGKVTKAKPEKRREGEKKSEQKEDHTCQKNTALHYPASGLQAGEAAVSPATSDSSVQEEAAAGQDKESFGRRADVSDGAETGHGSKPDAGKEQLPGQMRLERDFPQYCPKAESPHVAPVQPEDERALYLSGLKDNLEAAYTHAEEGEYQEAAEYLKYAEGSIEALKKLSAVHNDKKSEKAAGMGEAYGKVYT